METDKQVSGQASDHYVDNDIKPKIIDGEIWCDTINCPTYDNTPVKEDGLVGPRGCRKFIFGECTPYLRARVAELEADAKSPNRHLVAYCNRLQSVRELVDFIALQPCSRYDDEDCLQSSDCITEYCYPCMGRAMKKTFDDVSEKPKKREICDHYWVKAENEYVKNTAMCIRCYGVALVGEVELSPDLLEKIDPPPEGTVIHMYTKEELEEEQRHKEKS